MVRRERAGGTNSKRFLRLEAQHLLNSNTIGVSFINRHAAAPMHRQHSHASIVSGTNLQVLFVQCQWTGAWLKCNDRWLVSRSLFVGIWSRRLLPKVLGIVLMPAFFRVFHPLGATGREADEHAPTACANLEGGSIHYY